MRINTLTLYNFGIFAGENTLDLRSEKPVILIGGMNGRGKTTILEAILFALYGKRSFAFEESGLSFPKYLEQRVNISDGQKVAKVILEFVLSAENVVQTYQVTREWNLHSTRPSLKTIVLKNDVYDQLLSENWDIFIEEILPSVISPFFFFDGEKISDLATSNDDSYMKESIKSLLGINVIETAILDLYRIIKGKGKNTKNNTFSKELKQYEIKLAEADSKLKSAKEIVGLMDVKLIQVEEKLRKAENQFATMGGNLALNRKVLQDQQEKLERDLVKINTHILEMAAGDLPLLMILPLLEKILKTATIEIEQRGIQAALEQLPSLFHDYNKNNQLSLNIDDFISYVKKSTKNNSPLYNLTDKGYFQLQSLCSILPKRQKQEAIELLSKRENIRKEKTDIDNYLSVSVNEVEAGKVHAQILALTAEHATIEEQLRVAQEAEKACLVQYEEVRRQQIKVIEKAVGENEGAEEKKRTIIYATHSIDVLEEYKIRLQALKTNQLALTMSECFHQLISKKHLVKEIKIDENTLGFHYFNDKGEEVSHHSFSAGEKQLLVIAMLWALGKCSKKQFPVIVDTPLARLDSIHRKALVTNYFPNASETTILLSTDEEIYGTLYRALSPFIGKKYTLQYDEDSKKTSIKKGYFGGRDK